MALVRVMVGGREFRREVGSRLVIGRDVECDVQVNDPKISRLHCLIERQGDEYVAVDLDSHNGTMISGWPLTRQTLKHGDVLDLGVASLQFLVESSRQTALEAERLVREEAVARLASQSADDPAAIPRRGPAGRKASLWERAMRASEQSDPKARKRKRVKPEVLRKQLFEQKKSAVAVEEPIRIVRFAGETPWYHHAIPLKFGLPASLVLLFLIYVLANGIPSFNFGSSARNQPPKSLPHSSPYNND
jgi:pSer/pThr/pTyr-binding forkhead associated (FHA) protein